MTCRQSPRERRGPVLTCPRSPGAPCPLREARLSGRCSRTCTAPLTGRRAHSVGQATVARKGGAGDCTEDTAELCACATPPGSGGGAESRQCFPAVHGPARSGCRSGARLSWFVLTGVWSCSLGIFLCLALWGVSCCPLFVVRRSPAVPSSRPSPGPCGSARASVSSSGNVPGRPCLCPARSLAHLHLSFLPVIPYVDNFDYLF